MEDMYGHLMNIVMNIFSKRRDENEKRSPTTTFTSRIELNHKKITEIKVDEQGVSLIETEEAGYCSESTVPDDN